MPDWLFWLLRFVLLGMIGIGGMVWIAEYVIRPSIRYLRTRQYQWPVVSKGRISLREAWVRDVEERERGNPAARIVIVNQSININELTNPDAPHVTFTLWIFNGSAYRIEWQKSIGRRVRLNGNELSSHLPELIGAGGGWESGAINRLRIKQPLLKETADRLREQEAWKSDGSVVRNFSLADVQLEFRPSYEGAPLVSYPLHMQQPGGSARDEFVTATDR